MERKRIIASTVIVFLLIPTALWSQTSEWTTYNVSNSQLPFDRIGPLVFDAQGNLWIASGSLAPGSSAGGLAKFDGENWTVYYTSNSGLPCNNIHALAFDSQGNLWIGTGVPLTPGRGGLAKFDGENWTVYTTGNSGLPCNGVTALAIDAQGTIWVGTGRRNCLARCSERISRTGKKTLARDCRAVR